MELTTDATKFFTIIARDGMLSAPLSIVVFVGVFSSITSHKDIFYTSDSKDRVNKLLQLLCDDIHINNNQIDTIMIDYKVDKLGIRNIHSYITYEQSLDVVYYDLYIPYNYRSVWFTSCHIFFNTIIYEIQCLIYQ